MKRATIKGFIIGVCVTLALTLSVPALADALNAEVVFNTFRLRNGSGTVFDWGENTILYDGRTVPSSITYGGESYVSMSRLKELFGDNLQWNGDSSTYTFLEAGMQNSYELITEVVKADALGHMWKYQIRRYDVKPSHEGFFHIETNQYYLVVTDDERGYSRAYNLLGPSSYEFTEDCVYFAKYVDDKEMYSQNTSGLVLTELAYANTPDNQDGKELHEFFYSSPAGPLRLSYPYIDNGVMYYFDSVYGGNHVEGVRWRSHLKAVNCENPDRYLINQNIDTGPDKYTIDLVKDGYIMYRYSFEVVDPTTNRWIRPIIYHTKFHKASLDGTGVSIELSEEEYYEVLKR